MAILNSAKLSPSVPYGKILGLLTLNSDERVTECTLIGCILHVSAHGHVIGSGFGVLCHES